MIIHIATGIGTGPTKLSAFDAALNAAGVANYNLLRLSSVIPPRSQLVVHKSGSHIEELPGEWGDRLYVVMAEMCVDVPGQEAWSGIGWVQEDQTGKGLFVEHEGSSELRVSSDIKKSLEALTAKRSLPFGDIHMKLSGITCEDMPVCSLTVAVYQASSWLNEARIL